VKIIIAIFEDELAYTDRIHAETLIAFAQQRFGKDQVEVQRVRR